MTADTERPTDLVLGVSLTSTALRWVLVDGTTGRGAPIDRGALDTTESFDAEALLDTLLGEDAQRFFAIGVTWTAGADAAASALWEAFGARGLGEVVAVSELEAADALTRGVADIAGYDDVVVCVLEPDAAVVAVADTGGVTVDQVDPPLAAAHVMQRVGDRSPDAILVVGSGNVDLLMSSLATATGARVISAAEADLALARGAALASAQALTALQRPDRRRGMSRIGALNVVLAAASATFVVSVSVALGLKFAPDTDGESPQIAQAAEQPAPAAAPLTMAQAAPPAPPPAAPALPAAPPPPVAAPDVAETVVAAAPSVPEAVAEPENVPAYQPPAAEPAAPPPVYEPPPAAPPAPVYVPPAPVYAPQPATPPKPRLRDRIIERIPIVGRFHEPEYPTP